MTRVALFLLNLCLLVCVLFESYRGETAPAAYLGFMLGIGVTLTAQTWRKPERVSAQVHSLDWARLERRRRRIQRGAM